MHTYTETDFANARFAVHPDGTIAMRSAATAHRPWETARGYDTDRLAWEAADGGSCTDAEMAKYDWQIAHTATTAREALALVVDLAYEVEGDTLPDHNGHVIAYADGSVDAYGNSTTGCLRARSDRFRCLLLDPPKPQRPAGAEALEEWLSEFDYLHDSTGASMVDLSTLANDLAEAGVRAPEETR